MAREIIILEQVSPSDFNACFWLAVPVARQPFYANASFVSAFRDATVEEIAALRSGAVTEIVERINRPFGQTQNQLAAHLVVRHGQLQAQITTNNPWNRYGTSHDGTTWTVVTVA